MTLPWNTEARKVNTDYIWRPYKNNATENQPHQALPELEREMKHTIFLHTETPYPFLVIRILSCTPSYLMVILHFL
jgi:hypothetical protein